MSDTIIIDGESYIRFIYGRNTFTDYFVNIHNSGVYSMISNKKLKPTIDKSGYVVYTLYINGRPKQFSYHQLVAMVGLPSPTSPSVNEVDHLDGDKGNNDVTNLEWVTRKENVVRSVQTGLKRPSIGEKNGMCSYSDSQVHDIMKLLESGKSVKYVADKLDINIKFIYDLLSGKTRQYITCQYVIPDSVFVHKHHNPRVTPEIRNAVLQLKKLGYGPKYISEHTGINIQTVKNTFYYKKGTGSTTMES